MINLKQGRVDTMRKAMNILMMAGSLMTAGLSSPVRSGEVPEDFPRYEVPGEDALTRNLRELYHTHYLGAGPQATMWDEWLVSPDLWSATAQQADLRKRWRAALEGRGMAADGYVFTHQHMSIAHQEGWPFPDFPQGRGWGQFFCVPSNPSPWNKIAAEPPTGWTVEGATDLGLDETTWNLDLASPRASVTSPPLDFDAKTAPFIQLRWKGSGLESAQPYIGWATESAPVPDEARRVSFDPVKEGDGVFYSMIPMHRSPQWTGKITRLVVGFGNATPAKAGLQSIFTNYDTRHTINNPAFIRGCAQYYYWTGDLVFLRGQINRMRLALAWMDDELSGADEHLVVCRWPGHDGRTGLDLTGGGKALKVGTGIGSNYWDLLPFGGRDFYATIRYYDALGHMAEIEEAVQRHPGWNMPGGPLRQKPEVLRARAEKVRETANRVFWQEPAGRFAGWIDDDGRAHDYGFTFVNTEAVYYGIASGEHAARIMEWLAGERIIDGDTSQGPDIYRWRFGPRATTRRNIETYAWVWSGPETIPWGGQVQDGGAVLGFTHFDLMTRLATRGPDDALKRLGCVADWFEETRAEGGYRSYYGKDPARGTLQGGGTPGGLGIDHEFFESILATQIMIEGFLGLRAGAEGLTIKPRLPSAWPSLTISGIGWRDQKMTITVKRKESGGHEVAIRSEGPGRMMRLDTGFGSITTGRIGGGESLVVDAGER